jgi:N-glycosidase YbiA
MITFKKVKDAYGWMSNMSPHKVVSGARTWRTAEALFQALRFEPESEPFLAIFCEKSPMGAKMAAKANAAKMIIEPRSQADIALMKRVLRLKLKSNPDLIKELLDTGEHYLVEDVTNRPNESGLFWGMAKVEGPVGFPELTEWSGQNVLGNLWMDLRDACKAGKEHAAEWL